MRAWYEVVAAAPLLPFSPTGWVYDICLNPPEFKNASSLDLHNFQRYRAFGHSISTGQIPV